MRGQECRSDRGATRHSGQRGAPLAALAAAGLLLSACAAMQTAAAGPDAGALPEPAAQGAPAEGEQPAAAKPATDQPPGERPWAGVFSPLATIGYIPLKMLPCSLGIVGSAVGFLFTFDGQMVRDAITLNCGGDWIVTPGMLQGREGFRPVGRVEDLQGPPAPAPPPPAASAPPIREPGE